MIFGGPCEVRNGRHAIDECARKEKRPPQTIVYSIGSKLPVGHPPQPDNIVFTEADASWVHNPYQDAMVITTEVANSLVHRLLVDSESAVNILYWGAY